MPPVPPPDRLPAGAAAAGPAPPGDRRLTSLLEISRVMTAEADLDAALDVIMREAARALAAERCTLFLLDPERGELWPRTGRGSGGREARIPSTQGIAGLVVSTGRRVNIPNACEHPERLAPGTRSALAAPVLTGAGELLGVLEALNKAGGTFGRDDEELLEVLAAQTAVAIHNVRLSDDLRRANAELRKLDEMQSTFLATISHELRTPLAPILGYLQLFLSETEAPGPLTDRQRAGMEVMLRSAHRLQGLVEDLLTFAQLERGQLPLSPGRVGLEPLLRGEAAEAAGPAAEKGIEVRVEIPEAVPAVLADARALGRAVRLILDNAVKFTPAGGRITLSARPAAAGREAVCVAVADTGIGIPPHEVARIFDAFYQVDGSATRPFGGAGLGLALVKRLIEAHGSRVSVESRVGAGSTFAFVLPAA